MYLKKISDRIVLNSLKNISYGNIKFINDINLVKAKDSYDKATYEIIDSFSKELSKEKNSINEFLKGLLVDTRLLIEPKIDGCAVALQYRDGTLEKAISRKGADVTSKLIKVQDIPNNLPLRGVLQVRGELYAPNQSPNISQRIASGFLRAKEGFSESLSFCAFQILNSTLNQYESKKSLSKLGFTIPQDISCNFTSQVEVFRKQWLEGKLFSKYPTDGIVVKINSRKLQLIREKSNLDYPYWQVAIKR